jgi:hypothetical protein
MKFIVKADALQKAAGNRYLEVKLEAIRNRGVLRKTKVFQAVKIRHKRLKLSIREATIMLSERPLILS